MDLDELNRIRSVRDDLMVAMRRGDFPEHVRIPAVWVKRFESLKAFELFNVVSKHYTGELRFNGIPAILSEEESWAKIQFRDGSTVDVELGGGLGLT